MGLLVQNKPAFRRQMRQTYLPSNQLDFRRYAAFPHATNESSIQAALALELIEAFLTTHLSCARRHRRRLAKVWALELELPKIVP